MTPSRTCRATGLHTAVKTLRAALASRTDALNATRYLTAPFNFHAKTGSAQTKGAWPLIASSKSGQWALLSRLSPGPRATRDNQAAFGNLFRGDFAFTLAVFVSIEATRLTA